MANHVSLRMSLNMTCDACSRDSHQRRTWEEEFPLSDNKILKMRGTVDYCPCYLHSLNQWLTDLTSKVSEQLLSGTPLHGTLKIMNSLYDAFGDKVKLNALA